MVYRPYPRRLELKPFSEKKEKAAHSAQLLKDPECCSGRVLNRWSPCLSGQTGAYPTELTGCYRLFFLQLQPALFTVLLIVQENAEETVAGNKRRKRRIWFCLIQKWRKKNSYWIRLRTVTETRFFFAIGNFRLARSAAWELVSQGWLFKRSWFGRRGWRLRYREIKQRCFFFPRCTFTGSGKDSLLVDDAKKTFPQAPHYWMHILSLLLM